VVAVRTHDLAARYNRKTAQLRGIFRKCVTWNILHVVTREPYCYLCWWRILDSTRYQIQDCRLSPPQYSENAGYFDTISSCANPVVVRRYRSRVVGLLHL